ncbi:MAG: ABC transporter permease [Hyphomicrobiales bacterium]|jgi:peptide/nickel transport system permease protein|nr:ABC transporter permease [Hyphomicrobiales bacterium]
MTLAVPAPARARPSALRSFIAAQPLGAVSLLFILAMVFASLFAIWIVPHDPLKLDFAEILAPPSWSYPFGTDNLGRCVFSRVIFGARTALVIGILASLVGSTIGGLIGVVQGYFGGRLDFYVSRFVDILLSFPIIVLALVVVAMLGKKIVLGVDMNLVVAIAIPIIPKVARVVRSAALSVREMPYVDAARASGFSHQRIVLRHMVPNVFAPFIIMFTAFVAQAILLEASLSFLGLGVTEPTPAWGLMLAGNAADFYREAPWMIIFPGLAISLSVFAFNLFGDALRDHLDPRFKG